MPAGQIREPTLNETAVEWFTLRRSGDVDLEQEQRFHAWLAQSPAHAAAYAEIERCWEEMCAAARQDDTLTLNLERPRTLAEQLGRPGSVPARSWPRVAGVTLVLVFVSTVILHQWHVTTRWFSDYATHTGEQRRITLPDNSQVLLNTDTALSLDWSDARRHLILHHGQAVFTVAVDPTKRPFEVSAGPVTVRALGTVFEVKTGEAEDLDVTVQQHAVMVVLAGRGQPVRLRTGQRLHYAGTSGLGQPETADLIATTAWQNRQLMFNDLPLEQAMAELDRYYAGRIVVTDNRARHLRVSGVFPLDDPNAILDALRRALKLKFIRLGPWLVLVSRE